MVGTTYNRKGSEDELSAEEVRQCERIALAARVEQAMRYANMNRGMLRKQLEVNFGLSLSRSALSKIINAKVRHTRYALEMAQVMGVNPRWLSSGEETMTDLTGRLSSKDKAVRDLRRIARDYVIPPRRADIARYYNRLVAAIDNNQLSFEDIELLNQILNRVTNSTDALTSPEGDTH